MRRVHTCCMAQPKVLYRTGGPSALANTSRTGPCFATAYEIQPCGIHGELHRDPAFQKPINPRNEGGDAYRSLNSILMHVVTAVRPIAVTRIIPAATAQPLARSLAAWDPLQHQIKLQRLVLISSLAYTVTSNPSLKRIRSAGCEDQRDTFLPPAACF